MLHDEISGVRAPLGAVRRPKLASTFSLVKRFFFVPEKEMVQTPYYVIIKFFYMGSYTKKISNYHKYIIIQKISFENSLFR